MVSVCHRCFSPNPCTQCALLCWALLTVVGTFPAAHLCHPTSPDPLRPGIGLFFSAFMIGLTAVQTRYTSFSPKNADEFSSASRSVKPGLIASAVVSAWTWAATLVYVLSSCNEHHELNPSQLQSSAVAYKYGISGPWWYGAGATVQVLLFAQVRASALSPQHEALNLCIDSSRLSSS